VSLSVTFVVPVPDTWFVRSVEDSSQQSHPGFVVGRKMSAVSRQYQRFNHP
jgi:hypothetical protein